MSKYNEYSDFGTEEETSIMPPTTERKEQLDLELVTTENNQNIFRSKATGKLYVVSNNLSYGFFLTELKSII